MSKPVIFLLQADLSPADLGELDGWAVRMGFDTKIVLKNSAEEKKRILPLEHVPLVIVTFSQAPTSSQVVDAPEYGPRDVYRIRIQKKNPFAKVPASVVSKIGTMLFATQKAAAAEAIPMTAKEKEQYWTAQFKQLGAVPPSGPLEGKSSTGDQRRSLEQYMELAAKKEVEDPTVLARIKAITDAGGITYGSQRFISGEKPPHLKRYYGHTEEPEMKRINLALRLGAQGNPELAEWFLEKKYLTSEDLVEVLVGLLRVYTPVKSAYLDWILRRYQELNPQLPIGDLIYPALDDARNIDMKTDEYGFIHAPFYRDFMQALLERKLIDSTYVGADAIQYGTPEDVAQYWDQITSDPDIDHLTRGSSARLNLEQLAELANNAFEVGPGGGYLADIFAPFAGISLLQNEGYPFKPLGENGEILQSPEDRKAVIQAAKRVLAEAARRATASGDLVGASQLREVEPNLNALYPIME